VKEDLGFSTSEITIIGKALRVPGRFLSTEHEHTHSLSGYRKQLTQHINSLRSAEPRHPASRKTYLENVLKDCTHVFIRKPPNKPPLSPAYDGPFRVLSKHDKYYTMDLITRIDNVTIDRIKAAHLLQPSFDDISTPNNWEPPKPIAEYDEPALPENPHIPSPPTTPRPDRQDDQPADIRINRFGRRIICPRRFLDN